jgi:hypothetical protein
MLFICISAGAQSPGDFDYAFPDTLNSVTGNYGGMMIIPAPIAENIYFLLDNEEQAKKQANEDFFC